MNMGFSTKSTIVQSGNTARHNSRKNLPLLALGALGVIYGDIGTSPLYTIKECFSGNHGVPPTPGNILGILSMVFWSLMLVVGLKYVMFIMLADNKGEGGIFSLLAMVQGRLKNDKKWWSVLTFLAAFGAALLYGDGVITPAISVLSAIEGLNMATDAAADYIIPLTCLVLIFLFFIQRHGTAAIGRLFGPIMITWFLVLGFLGLRSIVLHPGILAALNPWCAVQFFIVNHVHGIVVLGSVVLCITGGEALYADMGHFGRQPIRLTWYGVVLPGLVLNYYGQGALLLAQPRGGDNRQSFLCPGAEGAALSSGCTGHHCYHYCLAGNDIGCLFPYPASHPIGVLPTHAHHPYFRAGKRPDLYADR